MTWRHIVAYKRVYETLRKRSRRALDLYITTPPSVGVLDAYQTVRHEAYLKGVRDTLKELSQ